jgi:hypothetical protein
MERSEPKFVMLCKYLFDNQDKPLNRAVLVTSQVFLNARFSFQYDRLIVVNDSTNFHLSHLKLSGLFMRFHSAVSLILRNDLFL